jgi:hypothetical protein
MVLTTGSVGDGAIAADLITASVSHGLYASQNTLLVTGSTQYRSQFRKKLRTYNIIEF